MVSVTGMHVLRRSEQIALHKDVHPRPFLNNKCTVYLSHLLSRSAGGTPQAAGKLLSRGLKNAMSLELPTISDFPQANDAQVVSSSPEGRCCVANLCITGVDSGKSI